MWNKSNKKKDQKLPLDMVYEVLTQCNVNALVSHRWVCKEWPPLLSNSHFINLHLWRTNTLRGFFLQSIRRSHLYDIDFVAPSLPSALPYLKFLSEAVKIGASTSGQTCHGLLCCVNLDHKHPRYYVCKLTTVKWTRIPSRQLVSSRSRWAWTLCPWQPSHVKDREVARDGKFSGQI